MTTKSIIAIAAAVAAGFALNAPSAEAGGGVRLGFGGPLIGFVARPALGYALNPHMHRHERHVYRPARTYQERPAPKKHVASRKSDEDKSAKARKKREEDKSETSGNDDSSNVKQLTTNSIPLEAATATTAATQSAPPVIKLDSTAVAAPATTEPKVDSAALVPAVADTATTPAKPEVKAEPKVEPKPAKSAEKKSDCRRFVPAAGITISVRCND